MLYPLTKIIYTQPESMKPAKTIFLSLLLLQLVFSVSCSRNKSILDFPKNNPSRNSFLLEPVFQITYVNATPVLAKGDPGTEGNKYGFEGGRAVKINDEYHIFITEMVGNPLWTKTRIGHWRSRDGIKWERLATLFESTGDFSGHDPRAALWSPMPTYHAQKNHWIMTYVAYNSKPNTDTAWYRNYNGKIWLAVSQQPGYDGLGGPYVDSMVVLQAGVESDVWEGLMGADSFFPFPLDGKWMAFYGSSPESVGLASSPELEGPWVRMTTINPVRRHIENPIVTRLEDGRYVALFDGCGVNRKIGYMVSSDGIYWSKEIFFNLEEYTNPWWGLTRTPLGLIQESNNTFTVFFTAYNKDFYSIPNVWQTNDDFIFNDYFASVGMFRLKLIR
jgi:hypothetical protein